MLWWRTCLKHGTGYLRSWVTVSCDGDSLSLIVWSWEHRAQELLVPWLQCALLGWQQVLLLDKGMEDEWDWCYWYKTASDKEQGLNQSHDQISFSLDLNLLSIAYLLFLGKQLYLVTVIETKKMKQAIHLTLLVCSECIFSRALM